MIEDAGSRDVVLEGSSECIRGGFVITADQMSDLSCNTDYELVAAVEDDHDDLIIRKKCEPMATIVDEEGTDNNSYYGKQCYFELEDDINSDGSTCYHVCYSSDKLYSRAQAEAQKCHQ